jgi:hypothetical protein
MEKRKPGRPKTNPTSIHLTLVPDDLARLDAFIAKQGEELSRAEGVRRVLDEALPPLSKQAASKAPAALASASKPAPATKTAATTKARPRRP